MFESLQMAPPDSILGLTEAFKKDPHPHKINLSVGVYQDAAGKTPVLQCVKEAERRLIEQETDKSYLPIDGAPEYGRRVRELLFGNEHEVVQSGRAVTVHTPGGTGGLRVAADFLHDSYPGAAIWCSAPTWPNHPQVFEAAGVTVKQYPYFDAATNTLAFDQMMETLAAAPPGDVVCLHGSCHNPTGIDPTPEQWQAIGDLLHERRLLPLVDFAYQGFGDGLAEDAAGILRLCRPGSEMLIVSSFSKNFSLYRERVGALTVVASCVETAAIVLSRVKKVVRANYSNPPAHGGAIVAAILGDAELRRRWEADVAEMRERINSMRRHFAEAMLARGVDRDFSFITRQRGMFSFSGLTPTQVDQLRTRYAIYIVGNGRINVAGMTEQNMDPLCDAIAAVV